MAAIKSALFRIIRKQETPEEIEDRRDQLAQPLLHDEEQRNSGRLEDIQEVDLEAGEGISRQPSSRLPEPSGHTHNR